MVKKIRHPETEQELIQCLLRQRAAEQALSRRWNRYSLLIISAVLVAVIILQQRDFSIYVVGGVALLGLCAFWLLSFVQGKKLEKHLYEQETEYYQNLPAEMEQDSSANGPSDGQSPLSGRELEVLLLIVQGNTNKEIARNMNITEQTTKNHITHLLKKMNVTDRTSAAVTALRLGWIKLGPDGQFEISNNKEPRLEE